MYAKTPLGGPAQVLEYLSRYTHRTAISNERIRAITDRRGGVLRCAPTTQGGKRLERLPGVEFVRRFLLHVLPTGIKRIRHYGVLASAAKGQAQRRAAALQMPQPNPQAMESAQGFMARVAKIDVGLCPCCKVGRLQVTAVLQGQARLPEPAGVVAQHSRGPHVRLGRAYGLASRHKGRGWRCALYCRLGGAGRTHPQWTVLAGCHDWALVCVGTNNFAPTAHHARS